MKKIGLYGGSFNPVHNEHINMAKAFISELNLDALYIIPTNIAPHKQGVEVVSAKDRLNMLSLAFKGIDKVQISTYELDKGGVSFTYLTVNHFKNLYKNSQIYLLMGSDMLDNFPTWKNPQEICDNAKLVLAYREGDNFDNDDLILKVKKLYGAEVIKLKFTPKELSSTEIRLSIKLGIDVQDKIPKSVNDYIIKNAVYGGDKFYNYVNEKLPLKRKIHTLGVILVATKLAKKLGVDVKKAELSALLHDIAKYEDYKNFKGFVLPDHSVSDVIHQYLGAFIAENILKVEDSEVIEAIKYHTTGKADMTALQKVIYIADLIEPSRKFSGVEDLRKEIEKDFEKGFIASLNEILDFLKKSNSDIYPLTIEAVNYYNKKGEKL